MRLTRWCSLAAFIWLQACAPAVRVRTAIEATPGRPDTGITSTGGEGGALVVEVTSPSGIGSAHLTIDGPMPKQMALRLLLKGMEKLEVAYGETTVTASLSSTPGYDVTESVRLAMDGEEREISPASPYWMAVTIVPAEDMPASIPLQQGYIEVQMPASFLSSEERALSIQWVDFFR
jgi:hypothetical protein